MSTAATATARRLRFGDHELELGGKYLGELRESDDLIDDPAALRARLAEDGCLLVRGLHDPKLIGDARRQILERVAESGRIDPSRPLMDAVAATGKSGQFAGGRNDYTTCPAYQELVRSPRLMGFFSRLRGGDIRTYDYQWLRVVGPGQSTGAHFDVVYMGRGTLNLLTCWTPIGDCPYEQGPLAVLPGTHRLPGFAKVRDTYGRMDVDRDHVDGWLSNDPVEMVDRFGGRWATTEFRAGDALIFGMFTLHASLVNVSDRFRISSDTRYQLADEPVDQRWIGAEPPAHYGWKAVPNVPMAEKRKEWGI